MGIIFRLRVVFWVLVLSLWGLIAQQFLLDQPRAGKRLSPLPNPLAKNAAARGVNFLHKIEQPFVDQEKLEPIPDFTPDDKQDEEKATPEATTAAAPEPLPGTEEPRIAASPGPLPTMPLPPEGARPPVSPQPSVQPEIPQARPLPQAGEGPRRGGEGTEQASKPEPALPSLSRRRRAPRGFHASETRHFLVYDQDQTDPKLLETLESLHGNLMLDLAAFAPWAQDEKATIFLFNTQQAYQKATGRPAWSGGASSLSKRTVYAYKSEELIGILAHELTHIYFDGFFSGGKIDPLWLSEGMATVVQTERGLAPPNWLEANLAELRDGGGFKLKDLMKMESTAGESDDAVRLWYSQSYSVVRFLMRLQHESSFYRFCRLMKDGQEIHQALLQAYGMPYNRRKALEYAWRYDLQNRTLTARQ